MEEVENQGNERTRYVAILGRDFYKPNMACTPVQSTDTDVNILKMVAEKICTTYADVNVQLAYVYADTIVLYIDSTSFFGAPDESDLASIATSLYIDECIKNEIESNQSYADDSYSLYKIQNMQRPVFRCKITAATPEGAIKIFKEQNKECIKRSKMTFENWDNLLDYKKYGVYLFKDGEACDGKKVTKTYESRVADDFVTNESLLRDAIHYEVEKYNVKELEQRYRKTYEMLMEHSKESLANYLACQAVFGTEKMGA